MSSRKPSSRGGGLPFGRYGQRIPLGSLDNEIECVSSKFKSKSQLDAVKMTMDDIALCDSDPHLHSPPFTKGKLTNPSDTTQTAYGIGDVTFKSFICAGGEVEISESSVSGEESIILPEDVGLCNIETQDTVIFHSMMEQSCCDHKEHPYFNPDGKELLDSEVSVSEIPNTTLSFDEVEDKQGIQDFHTDCSGEKLVTWKSFVCDGGEVELSDASRLQDDTIPLPIADPSDPSEDNSINSTYNSDDHALLIQKEHADHPYCISENGIVPVITSFSVPANGSVETDDGLWDVTFKTIDCTGGEVEISEETKLSHETVLLPVNHSVAISESYNYSMNPSMLASDHDLQNVTQHLDHPYYDFKNDSSPRGNLVTAQVPLPCTNEAVEVKQTSVMVPDNQGGTGKLVTSHSFTKAAGEAEKSDIQLSEETFLPCQNQDVNCQPLTDNVSAPLTGDHIQDENEQPDKHSVLVDAELVINSGSPVTKTSSEVLDNEIVKFPVHEMSEISTYKDSMLPSVVHRADVSDWCHLASAESPAREVQQLLDCVTQVCSTSGPSDSSEAKDSALGSSSNGPIIYNSAEKPEKQDAQEHLQQHEVLKMLSNCPSIASALELGILSPIVKKASLSLLKAHGDPAQDQFLVDYSALEDDKSFVAPVNSDPAGLLAEIMESPMPRPLFNSTAVSVKPQPGSATEQNEDLGRKLCAAPRSVVEKPVLDNPLVPEAQLHQFRQMVELLVSACGKMGPAVFSVSAPPPSESLAPPQRVPPLESHSVCVGTSPVKLTERSLNTSGLFERKREFSVVDSCTVTDPLLWNLPPGSLECLPRQELEERLRSSMIMVEALAQQLAAARTQRCLSAGPAPSDLREKLVQTDHTELSQTTMYRELYTEALRRINELELDESSLQSVMQCMQDTRVTMALLSSNTDASLSNLKEMDDIVREDHQSLISHYGHMKSLLEKSTETQTRMMEKVKEVLQQRHEMRAQMEEAFTAKEAAFSAMEQLRKHCAKEISALEESVGSQQELLATLNQTYPEQVELNKVCAGTLRSASELLSQTMDEHSNLMIELCTVRSLLQKTAPTLMMLNEKAADAIRERDEHISARDQADKEREQIEEELNETHSSLQNARQQIGDLNLQVTILTSEMGVLRQKLTEKEEETGQLERKATELSATVSSTLASYTFLEQALAAETTKLQQSWKDIHQANERADTLEASLRESEQRVSDLSQALAQSEEQLSQLQTVSQSQSLQIQQLQDACAQLSGVWEMNEFLQMENELAREQVSESEHMLRTNLQGLRERNVQCEDLKREISKLQLENTTLHEEMETTRSTAEATQLELEEKIAQAVTEITLLHHTLRGVASELHAALNDQTQDLQKDKESQLLHAAACHQPSSSFVSSVMVALTTENEEDMKTDPPAGSDTPELQSETLFSETSAFTRIAPPNPKENLIAVEVEEDEEQSSVTELLSGLGSTVTELTGMLKLVQRHKDAQLQELHSTIYGLQVEQQAANNRHQAEVFELKSQLSRLNTVVERGNQALQQKAQDEKTLTKLMADVQEAQEILNKHKTDNSDLRKDVIELRRALQQSKVETQFLREELRKAGGQSANPVDYMEEKIQLLKEMERLRASLQDAEQARVKLLERAKRHQIIHQTNQQKSENELQILNSMINKVRETLLSLPEVVKKCEQLQQLVQYIG
ncbi:sperm-associated antigen 5 [Melanotaenia boesemani]|uniref:sperm-associated antigen 5 n=1 Tax=Melanotaenia boesemani TaxID=1250792 RepID=UPI001C04B572|nr:sperm-associated antigen 5 [Melanotaenia boesemani]XP_041839975.1 sperm-associated antigen 5 [Melanotaenia boesemani]XP_041839976.1 sperm-associated antigen 5 [Melanotaenia boesemani]